MKKIVNENQRGLLFSNGKFVKMLKAGKYYTLGGRYIHVVSLDAPLPCDLCPIETFLQNSDIAAETTTVEVEDEQLALHFVNGKFKEALKPGKYAFWTAVDRHQFTMVSTAQPEVAETIPTYIFEKMPVGLYSKVEVAPYEKARLYYNETLVKLLEPGTYYFWRGSTKVKAEIVDTRLTRMEITGQEILTRDKVALRINFVCNYRITDYVKVLTEIDDYQEQLHVAAQLTLREYVGKYTVDELLENKEQLSLSVFDALQKKAAGLYLELADAGVKDIIFPGEIREIMNTVLVAEKRAQANVIARREEVASTRSLLNTAKLMDENATLYKLKELEYLEKICENVGTITVNGNSDLLSQLTRVLHG